MSGYLVPTVLERTANGERAFDLYSRLLNERIVMLGTQVDDASANVDRRSAASPRVPADPDKDINLYITSPGGSVSSMFTIYDAMQHVPCDVSTTAMGLVASAASVLLAAGAPGKRFVLPNSRVMIHQPHGGAQGQQIDIEIQAKEMAFSREADGGDPGRGHRSDRRAHQPRLRSRPVPRRPGISRLWPGRSHPSFEPACRRPRRRQGRRVIGDHELDDGVEAVGEAAQRAQHGRARHER